MDNVECDDCEEQVALVRTDEPALELHCGCEFHSIDVSELVGDSSLFHPITGKWSDLNDE